MMKKRVLKCLGFLFLVYVIVWSTLFIPRPVQFPERIVKLGYPISFVTLDFSTLTTPMGGAPDYVLERRKFNITSSWENTTRKSQSRFIISYMIVLFVMCGFRWMIGKMIRKVRKHKSGWWP